MGRIIAVCAVAVVLSTGAKVAACPKSSHGGASDAYARSQFGKHVGSTTHVSATPREVAERSHLPQGYGKHLGTRKHSR